MIEIFMAASCIATIVTTILFGKAGFIGSLIGNAIAFFLFY